MEDLETRCAERAHVTESIGKYGSEYTVACAVRDTLEENYILYTLSIVMYAGVLEYRLPGVRRLFTPVHRGRSSNKIITLLQLAELRARRTEQEERLLADVLNVQDARRVGAHRPTQIGTHVAHEPEASGA